MRRNLVLFFIPFLLFASSSEEPPAKWKSLFNGKDLANWQPKFSGYEYGVNFANTFRVQNGLLSVRYDRYDSFRNRFGALHYDKHFKNFRLRVEYRFVGETAPGGPSWGFRDSGIQYYGQDPRSMLFRQNFPVCLEYNLHGGNGKDERPVGEICANGIYIQVNGKRNESYCTTPSVRKTFHGDEWVVLEVECRKGKCSHFVNGVEILNFEEPRYDPKHDIAKTLIVNGNDKVSGGYISLQSNSHPIDFRKIEIMEY